MPPEIAARALRVAVVGSVNLDLVARVARFPQPGETLSDARIARHPGGKGANQALAARRLGAQVWMVACVGDDPVADEALAGLRAEGVDLSRCRVLPGTATGQALILVADGGENQIVVAPGANAAFTPASLALPEVDCLVAQLEVPGETLLAAALQHQGLFVLNAAPVRPVAPQLLARTDVLVVNEIEAGTLQGQLAGFDGLLAVTLGSRGAVLYRHGQQIAQARPPRVEVLDTTGAGDAFTAALAVGLASGIEPAKALQRACCAGALATTKAGAQAAPTSAELDAICGPQMAIDKA